MILFEEVYDCFVIEFVVLGSGLKFELTKTEEHSVVDVETYEFAISIF